MKNTQAMCGWSDGYGADGKKCRNWDSNPRNNFRKRESKLKANGLLFDTEPLLKDERLRQYLL